MCDQSKPPQPIACSSPASSCGCACRRGRASCTPGTAPGALLAPAASCTQLLPRNGLKREWEQAAKYQLLSGVSLPFTHLENDTQAAQGEGGDERHTASLRAATRHSITPCAGQLNRQGRAEGKAGPWEEP